MKGVDHCHVTRWLPAKARYEHNSRVNEAGEQVLMSVAALGWVVDRCLLPGSSALGVTYSQASEVLIVTILSPHATIGSVGSAPARSPRVPSWRPAAACP